jgi:hypothetical protein
MPVRATARLVAAFETHHRLVVEMRGDVLDRLELQTRGLDLIDQRPHVLLLPAAVAGEGGIVHLQAGGTDLRRKAQPLFGQFVKLAYRNPDTHCHSFLLFECVPVSPMISP